MKSNFKNFAYYLFINLFLFIGFLSCKKEDKSVIQSDPNDVYVAGQYRIGNSAIYSACWWKNGSFNTVDDITKISVARDITVVNGVTYLVGNFDTKPCYWKNATRYDLSENNTIYGEVKSLVFVNGLPYMVGNSKTGPNGTTYATLWKIDAQGNPTKILLNNSISNFANGIALKGSEIYICGYDNTNKKAGYWVISGASTIWHELGGIVNPIFIDEALDIVINNQNVFITARYVTGANGVQWSYWKNDILSPNTLGNKNFINSIGVNQNQEVILVGSNIETLPGKATYWLNTLQTFLPSNGTDAASASDIAFSGNQMYISGTFTNPNDQSTAYYWKDGKAISLNTPNSFTEAIAVFAK